MPLFERWARFATRHRGKVILAWAVVFAAAAVAAFNFGGSFGSDFRLPGSEAQRGVDLLAERFPQRAGDTADLVFETDAGFDDPAIRSRIEALAAEVAAIPGVALVETPYDDPDYISAGGTIARGVVRWNQRAQDIPVHNIREYIATVDAAAGDGLRIETGGRVVMMAERTGFGSEGLGLLAAVFILFIAFGSVVAMGLPIAAALFGIGIGTALIALLANLLAFPDFTAQFVAMIGIGVGIDYSLLVVTRYREALHRGLAVTDAVAEATATAGRSVVFAGAVVAIAFFGLFAMGLPAIAYLGAAAALIVGAAVLVSIGLMPALLGVVGNRIDRWHVPFLHSKEGVDPSSAWYRLSRAIQRRPWPYAVGATVLLVALAAPALDLRLGFTDAGNNPTSQHTRRSYDLLSEGFGPGFNAPILTVIDAPAGTAAAAAQAVAEAARATPNVASVEHPVVNPAGDTAIVVIFPDSAPQAEATSTLVHTLRRETLPPALRGTGASVALTGFSAVDIDIQDRLSERMPYLFAGVIGLSFILLMAVFRSVLVPLKAAILNLLSIGAAYGVIVVIFQWGLGKGLVGVDTGPVEPFLPMMFFAILFGLSMDYEVFLISRIREIYVRTGENGTAVAEGLAATARVISAAAAIMCAVFLAFVLGDHRVVKMVGIGLATAIFVDATVVRLILVPATMELLGRANWWLPGWLSRVLPEIHLEAPAEAAPAALSEAGSPAGGH
jgi:RND superfamily putative drug exporter